MQRMVALRSALNVFIQIFHFFILFRFVSFHLDDDSNIYHSFFVSLLRKNFHIRSLQTSA